MERRDECLGHPNLTHLLFDAIQLGRFPRRGASETLQVTELLNVEFNTKGLDVFISVWALIGVVVAFATAAGFYSASSRGWFRWRVEEAQINLGKIGHIKIKPNADDIQIAHRAWIELVTRKAGLPFDKQNDVITDIYDSWYTLFACMRDLAKEVPADRIRTNENTRKLVVLLVDALNQGLRPHLTKWQARFRRWYSARLEEFPERSPQEIQEGFPQYDELVSDLQVVNEQLVEYEQFIRKIAQGS